MANLLFALSSFAYVKNYLFGWLQSPVQQGPLGGQLYYSDTSHYKVITGHLHDMEQMI